MALMLAFTVAQDFKDIIQRPNRQEAERDLFDDFFL